VRLRATKPSSGFVLRGPWPRAAVVVHGGSRCVPNVRAKPGPAAGRQAREADDEQHGFAGLVARRWASA
jgi:hypothetical protein